MNVLFVEPAFPASQREFVRALAQCGARVTGIGERPLEHLDPELKSWMQYYDRVPSVVNEHALLQAVRNCQRREWVDVPADRFTYFSHQLDRVGYHNTYFGKWHVEQSNQLEDFGWPVYDRSCAAAKKRALPGTEVLVPKEGYPDYRLAAVGADDATPSHPAFDRGIAFIRDHLSGEQADRPFCCAISTAEPHDAYIPPQRFFDMYDPNAVRLSPTLRDEPNGKPEVVKRMRNVWLGMTDAQWQKVTAAYWALITFLDNEVGRVLDVLRETGQYDNDPVPSFDELYKNYCETVHGLDENIGKVLDHLDKTGLSDSTVVLYMGDNGFELGEHGFYDKRGYVAFLLEHVV